MINSKGCLRRRERECPRSFCDERRGHPRDSTLYDDRRHEQYTYLVLTGPDGEQDFAHIRGGTRLLLNGLRRAVEETRQWAPAGLRDPEN
jgi:hypothetical protein